MIAVYVCVCVCVCCQVERSLEEERERVRNYLLHSTEVRLLRVLDEELLEKRQTELLEKVGLVV